MTEGGSHRLPAAAVACLRLALRLVCKRSMLLPAGLLLLALTVTEIVVVLNQPMQGSSLPVPFVAATLIRIAAVLLLSAAILRLATGGVRSPWIPDGAFWLYALLFTLSLAVPAILAIQLGDIAALRTSLLANATATLLVSPFTAWIVAAAVERPVAARPTDWLRNFEQWLPHRIGWGLLLLVPLAALHSRFAAMQLDGSGSWFWPIALADGILSFLILMIRLGLDAAAYRRVALQ